MSADSPRRTSGSRGLAVPATVPPQVVSDRSILDSAIGFINDVTLVHQPITDPKDTITWARFETAADVSDPHFGDDWELEGNAAPPLLLILGYGLGVQVWAIPANGEAVEVLSWRHGVVSSLRILPTPTCASALDDNGRADERIDAFAEKRPLIALVDGGTGAVGGATGIGGGMGGGVGSMGTSPQFCAVNFVSLKTGGQVKTIKFKNPVLDIQANRSAVAITFHERIAIFDARTLEDRLTVISCYPSPGINPNPIALGPRWLAYAEHKVMHTKRSGGGCDGEGVPSYTATVLNAAKSFGKGLRELGEQMAAGLTGTTGSAGSSKSSSFDSTMGVDAKQPGVVTIIDTKYPIKDYSPTSGTPTSVHGAGTDPIVAHFVAHTEALVAMEFDSSGMLLLTADRRGHDFHVFRVQPHPVGSSLAAVHHLYVLHRGDTSAKVQNIAFSLDSRWVAVSTLRGTTHVFPITPYGGAMGVRTHTSLHVVNKLSRFHRSAGLSADGRSSSPISHSESTTFMQSLQPYHNPTLPPFPRPTVVQPLTQLRQPFALGSPPGSAGLAAVSGKLGGVGGGVGGTVGGASQRQRLSSLSDDSGKPLSVCAIFAKSRSWLLDPPNATREAPHRIQRKAVDSLFVMAGHGALIQYDLDTKLASNVAKEKICDDTPIELEVEAKAQWNLGRRKDGSQEIVPPLALDNWLIKDRHACMLLDSAHNFDDADDRTESWLSQVEIITHAGPHRRLWMGPQFVFKNYNTPSGSNLNHVDTEAVEIGVAKSSTGASAVSSAAGATIASIGGASNTAATASAVSAGSSSGGGGMGNMSVRNERSSPLNMPLTAPGRAAGVPVLIESGSIEQSPKLMDRFRHGHLDSDFGHGDIRLKEDLADAMRESPSANAARRETGRLLLSSESAAHAVSAASAVAATTSNAASSENAYFYDALTEHDDANENDDDDNDDDDNNNDEENDDDDDNDENIGGINDSNNDKKQNASGNNKKNSRRFNQKVGSTNATGAAVVTKSNVIVVAQKTSGSKARPTTIAETTSAKIGSTGSAASASAAALATALPNIYSYDHNSGNSSAKNNNKTNSSTAAKIEKIVNPLGTVTTITAGITSDVQTDVLDEVVGQLAAEDCIIHENCDEALFRPVVAIFCNDREEMQRSEKSKQVAEHCKPPVVITNKLIVPVIAKEVDDVLTQKEKQQKSNVKSKQQRQQQLQQQQAERKQAEQQQQQRFDELSNLSKRCKDNNSSSKAKSEVSHTPSVTRQRQVVATASAKPTWEQSSAADSGLKYDTPKLEEHSKEKEKDKQRRDSLEVSLAVLKPSTAKGTDDETNNKKKEQKTAQRVPTKTATVAKGAEAEPKTPSMSKLEMKTVAVMSTKAVADTAASVNSTKATTKTSKITGDKEEDDSEKKTEKTHEPLPERIKTNILDVANLVDSLRDIRSNDDDDDDNDIKADEEAKKSSELQADNSPDTLDTSVELLAKLKVSKKPNNKKDKKNNVSKPNSSSESELKAEDISTSIRLNKDTSAQQDDESVGEDLADNLLEQKSKIAKTMISSATAKGLKIEIETRQDHKLTQRKQSAAQTDNDKAINMEVDTVEEMKNSKHNVLKMTVHETKTKDQKLKQETTQNEKVDVKRQSGGSGGSGVTDGSEDDTTIVKITNGKQETEITATKQTTPKKHAGKAGGDQAALLQDKKLATMPAKSAGALTSTTVTKKAGPNEAPKTYTVKVIEERSSSTDSTNSSNSSGNEGKAVNEKQLSPSANKKQNKLKNPETNSVKSKTEETLTQSRVSTPTVASAWKNLSGAEVLSRNVGLNTSTDVSDYPSLASSTSPAKKPTKLSALPEMKSEISEKLLPSLPTPMKPAVVAPVSLSSPQEFKEPFSKTLTSTNASLSGKKSKKIVEGNSGHFDDFLLLKPLESLPPLPALEPLEVLTKTIAESEANGKSTTLAEQMSLINFESPLQENPALQRKITPPPRGFSEQNLIFALCGSLHYENEFAKSADESATSVVKHNVPPLSSSKSTSSSNNSSGSEEIIVVEEPKKLSKKHKRSKQQLEQLQKQRNEQSLPSAAATAADDDDELRPLISMSDSQLDSYAETPAGQQLTANEELLQFSDLTCKTSSKRDAANASPLAQSTSTTTDSDGPIPATTSDDNLYMPAATSAATPHKLKTKKLEHKINLIAAIEAATSSSTSSAEESSVETGGPSSGSTLIGDTISGAGTGTGALNGLGVDTHSKGTGHSASVLGGTLPLSAVMSSSGGIATTTGGGGVGAVVNSAAGNQQSATKKKTKRRKR